MKCAADITSSRDASASKKWKFCPCVVMCTQNSLLFPDVLRNVVLIWDFVTNSTAPLLSPIVTETMLKRFAIHIVCTFFQVCASPPILRKGPRMRWEWRIKTNYDSPVIFWIDQPMLANPNFYWTISNKLAHTEEFATPDMIKVSRDGSEPRKSVRLSMKVVEIPRPTYTYSQESNDLGWVVKLPPNPLS